MRGALRLAALGAALCLAACSGGELVEGGSGLGVPGVGDESGSSDAASGNSDSGEGSGGADGADGADSTPTTSPGGCADGQTRPCYDGPAATEGVGICRGGQQTCSAGAWSACEGEVQPGVEACNGDDDDCDGTIDGPATAGAACMTGQLGPCAAGTLACNGGVETCEPDVTAAAEECGNTIDDDCDGDVDEDCTATTCEPLSPATQCGANNHCVPQSDGTTLCLAPTGVGTQYDGCGTRADCAPQYECIETPFATVYCMQWCASDFDCGFFDLCTALEPAAFAGTTDYGVCWDGLP